MKKSILEFRRSKEEDDLTLCIAYNFEFIDDTYMLRVANEDCDGEQLVGFKSAYDDDFKLHKDAQSYASNYDRIYKNHPLKLMADAERLSLLSHPLSMALLKYKWNRLGRVMYYSGESNSKRIQTSYVYSTPHLPDIRYQSDRVRASHQSSV